MPAVTASCPPLWQYLGKLEPRLAEGASPVVGWLAPSPRTGLVLDDMQVVSVKVAVALCADAAVAPGDLGPMAHQRVPLGPGMNALCERLRVLGMPSLCPRSGVPGGEGLRLAARDGERVDAIVLADSARAGAGRHEIRRPPTGRVVVRLSPAERGLLRAACERLLGLLDSGLLDLTDERAGAVREGIEAVLADLRQPTPGPVPGRPRPPVASMEPVMPVGRSARALMPSSILRSMKNSTGGVSKPLLSRLHGASE